MSGITEKTGIAPKIRECIDVRDAAMAGDLVWRLTPATVAPAPTAAGWTRNVLVELIDSAGRLHEWYSDAITTGNSIADTSTAGTASIVSTTLTIVNGKAVVVVTGDAADWLDTETDTYTVAQATILGYTVAAKTSVETFTA